MKFLAFWLAILMCSGCVRVARDEFSPIVQKYEGIRILADYEKVAIPQELHKAIALLSDQSSKKSVYISSIDLDVKVSHQSNKLQTAFFLMSIVPVMAPLKNDIYFDYTVTYTVVDELGDLVYKKSLNDRVRSAYGGWLFFRFPYKKKATFAGMKEVNRRAAEDVCRDIYLEDQKNRG